MTEIYDYVIVGAGSAGCVLANRLSADPNNQVCLIEAGPRDRSPLIHIPLGMLPLMHHKILNWRFKTVPQAGAANRSIYTPRGKTLGGSSSINGMVYMRGHRLDYDEWAELGNPGWSYREVLPYFLKSENNEIHGAPYHGKGGPLNVTDCDTYSPLVGMMEEAAQSMQWPLSPDFNGANQEGFGKRQANMLKGRRVSTSTAFLKPALQRPNLTVITEGVVDKVTFAGKRATGIQMVGENGTRHVEARREVILSAGTIGSPMILMRSGVGDAEELRGFGIDPVQSLPAVGRNLQDHLLAAVHHKTTSRVPYGLSLRSLPWAAWQVVKYALFRKGLLANNIVHACGFVRTDPALSRPDIQFILLPVNRTPENPGGRGHGYGLIVLLLRPKSWGRVSLTSADPHAEPMIDPKFLTEPEDTALMVKGFRLARQILASPSWDSVRGPEMLPGPNVQGDRPVLDYIRRTSATAFHPVGTCKMGSDPASAVVDAELRVHGTLGLRVVDASVMPRIVGGNTNAPTIMIAEKASDMILGNPALPAASAEL